MKTSRPREKDIFARRPVIELRASLNRLDIAAEADVAGLEPFMEATIAAAMVIAHADGEVDAAERRRIISLFRANPLLGRFSAEDIAREIASHSQAFERDNKSATARARAQIVATDLTSEQFGALLDICVSVLEADGVRHAVEEQALQQIALLRPWGHR
jgi:tellurite resistance protein